MNKHNKYNNRHHKHNKYYHMMSLFKQTNKKNT